MLRRRIMMYPHGSGDGKGNSVSMFLSVDESSLPPDTWLVVRCIIRMLDENESKADPFEFTGEMITITPEFNILPDNKIFMINKFCGSNCRWQPFWSV